jgi:glycerol-3-phosphate cytidylyltransferase-like family protein
MTSSLVNELGSDFVARVVAALMLMQDELKIVAKRQHPELAPTERYTTTEAIELVDLILKSPHHVVALLGVLSTLQRVHPDFFTGIEVAMAKGPLLPDDDDTNGVVH